MPFRKVNLQGLPIFNENGVAGEADILPGMLVGGVSTIIKHPTAGALAARTFAMERAEMGEGINVPYRLGDVVKVGSFAPGDVVAALVPSGETLEEGDMLESAGNGRLRVGTPATAIGRYAGVGPVNAIGDTRVRVEIM